MLVTPKLNIIFLIFPCLLFAQTHISDFISIRKGAMTNEFKIPNTHKFQIIIEEGDLRDDATPMPDKFDFTAYVPIAGSSENGYLSINSEQDPGDVSILDINFNPTTKLWAYTAVANLDFSAVSGTQYNCSGTVTPWNTVITCEERTTSDGPDADLRNDIGWCIELDPVTKSVGTSENPKKLWALGNLRHENVVIDPSPATNNRVLYFGEDINNGHFYKFVAETPKDFTNGYDPNGMTGGKLYVYSGFKNGAGTWKLLNNFTDAEQNTTRSQSNTVGGATFNGGVEDVEINPIDNNIYFAVKGLGESCIYKVIDPDPLSGSSIPTMSKYAGGASKQYEVLPGVFEAWGDGVDNLAFDDLGNLWSMQDDNVNEEGFIWIIENGHVDGSNEKAKIFGQVPIDAEPTGITFSPDYRFMFMSIMHPSSSNNSSQKDAQGITLKNDKDVALVISRIEELGTTYIYDNGWVDSAPSGSSPTYSDIIIKNGNAEITQSMSCYNVIVKPGASLKVNTGVTLTVEHELTLESESTTYSSLLGDGLVSGTIKYQRYVNAQTNRNDLVAPPLEGQSWSDFLSTDSDKNNPNELNIFNDGLGSPTYLFGPFEKGSTDAYINYNSTTSVNLIAGKGYRAATNNASTLNGTQLTFTGNVITSNPLAINIVNDVTGNFPEWNLIGNPYPAYINVNDFLTHEVNSSPVVTNLDLMDINSQAIYGYDATIAGGYWTIYNLATPNTTLIAPGQGFFVSADDTNEALYDMEFITSMRRSGSTDDFIVGRRNDGHLGHVQLRVNSATSYFNTDIYFNSNASAGLDPGYDAAMFGGVAPAFSVYTQLVEENSGIPMAIQALGQSNISNVTIPLGINVSQGTSVSVQLTELDLPSTIDVYLEDNENNTFTLLNHGTYNFTPSETLNNTGRFFLRFEDRALSTLENELSNISIYTDNNFERVVISGLLTPSTSCHLYDMQGRIVITKQLDYTSLYNDLDVSQLETGVYIVQLQSPTTTKLVKVVIK